jgi:hypothetical protein
MFLFLNTSPHLTANPVSNNCLSLLVRFRAILDILAFSRSWSIVPVLVVQLRCLHKNYSSYTKSPSEWVTPPYVIVHPQDCLRKSLFHLLNMAEDVQNDLCHHSVHQLPNTHRNSWAQNLISTAKPWRQGRVVPTQLPNIIRWCGSEILYRRCAWPLEPGTKT